jgi:hypothetical protein
MEGKIMLQARAIFDSLKTSVSLQGLIGTNETLHLEVKEGKGPLSDDLKGYVSQALSGFANSDGGVLVLGMTAKKGEKGQPDQITAVKPFDRFQAAASDIESLIGQAVTPIVEGVEVIPFASERDPNYGYVVTYIPASDSGPHRANVRQIGEREYWKRAGDGFYKMEHFDIADMFGRRRRPRVRLVWQATIRDHMSVGGQAEYTWSITLSLKNDGRAIARFPMLRLEFPPNADRDSYGLDGNHHDGLPQGVTAPSERGILYLGREGDIIHPGMHLAVTRTERLDYSGSQRELFTERFVFGYKIAAEDQALEEGEMAIEPEELWQAVPRLFGFPPEP